MGEAPPEDERAPRDDGAPRWREALRRYLVLDSRSLAAYRIGLGILLAAEHSSRLTSLEAHLTDEGVITRRTLAAVSAHPPWSLFMLDGSAEWAFGLTVLALVVGLLLTAGVASRAMAVLSWLLLMSAQARNPLVNHADDGYLALLVLFAAFAPLDRHFTLPERLRRRPPLAPRAALTPGTLGLMLTPIALYWHAAISKMEYPSWQEGRAVYAVLHKAHYVRPLGVWAAEQEWLVRSATYGTLVAELLIAILLISPIRRDACRTAAIALHLAFQAGLMTMLDIGLFQPIAMVSVLPLLPARVWRRLPAGAAERPAPPPWRVRARALWHGVGYVLLAVSALTAVIGFAPSTLSVPDALEPPVRRLGLTQRWRMFANMDTTMQGWWVVRGVTAAGLVVDAQRMRPEVSLERPPDYAAEMGNDSWRIYWSNISKDHYAIFRPGLARYWCRRWNALAEAPEQRLVRVQVLHVVEEAYDPAIPPRRGVRPLVDVACPEEP